MTCSSFWLPKLDSLRKQPRTKKQCTTLFFATTAKEKDFSRIVAVLFESNTKTKKKDRHSYECLSFLAPQVGLEPTTS